MSACLSAEPKNFITLATGEWPPYTTAQPLSDRESARQAAGYGIAVDIINEVLNEMHYIPHLEFMGWSKTLDVVEHGLVRAAFPFVRSEKREQFAYYSDSLFKISSVLFYNIDRLKHPSIYQDYRDLAKCTNHCRVGIVRDYAYPEEILENISNPLIIDDERLAFRKLISGEIDMLPSDQRVAQVLLDKHYPTAQHQIAVLPGLAASEQDVYLIAGRNNPENAAFIERFNDVLGKLRKAGDIDRILERYLSEDELVFEVRLTTINSYPLIFGTPNNEENISEGLLIPRGTHAIVVSWHKSFHELGQLDVQRQMREKSLVKIMEGPLKGELLWVPNIFISFE
jgi:polar amino acid transport system substrate-binding protein